MQERSYGVSKASSWAIELFYFKLGSKTATVYLDIYKPSSFYETLDSLNIKCCLN